MNTIKLHGTLGEKYAPEYELEVSSPREALRALFLMVEGLAEDIKEGAWRVVRGNEGSKVELSEEMLGIGMGDNDLHIIPAVKGAGGGGGGKIILGVVMVAAAFFTAGASFAAMSAFQAGVAVMGGAMIVSGITTMTTQVPATDVSSRSKDNQESFLFDGPVNVTAQGGPVYLIYGEVLTGSVVIGSGLEAEDIAVGEDVDETSDIESQIKGAWNG